MSFASQMWSTDTLERGLQLAEKVNMSVAEDPDPAAMMEALKQLQDPLCQEHGHS